MLWIVAATGPSLSREQAERCKGLDVIAVNDAYKLFPYARILYASDAEWWRLHRGVPSFAGEKWITVNDNCYGLNIDAAKDYGLKIVPSIRRQPGFRFEPGAIHLGGNSGFQAVNMALQRGAKTVVLVGFDMQGSHFFGEHPPMPRRIPGNKGFARWLRHFEIAAKMLPEGIRIINATPDSKLACFPMMPLEEALAHA
jgi:hypothetical protein